MPNQHDVTDLGGTLRLGSYPCVLSKDSKSYELYGTEYIHERHRHRYEVNNDYRKALTDNGMELVGLSPDGSPLRKAGSRYRRLYRQFR